MKKLLVLFAVMAVLFTSSAFAQNLNDYIDSQRGDTLVVKDFTDMGNEANSLFHVMDLDTLAPAGRVYELKTFGYYPLINGPTAVRPTVIFGQETTRLVQNDDANAAPPLICGYFDADNDATPGINASADLTFRNVNLTPANTAGTCNWNYTWGNVADITTTFDNCLLERTKWVFTATGAKNSRVIKDCYAVNLLDEPCRRNGGIMDVFTAQGTLLVENTTHVNVQGLIYKYRNHRFDKITFNHNNFINCSNLIFLDAGYQANAIYANNIFVNCQVQPYGGVTIDPGEEDEDQLPEGLINVRIDPVNVDTVGAPERHINVQNNVIYWDPKLDDVVATANANMINGHDGWTSQMITMNTRTQAAFDDNVTYPFLYEGNWIAEMPNFADGSTLLTDHVDSLKAFSLSTVDTTSLDILPQFRVVMTGAADFIYADFPIPIDLSYDNASLLDAATNGFPVGDLNWFPAEKTTWLAQRDAEYASLDNDLANGTSSAVEENVGLAADFELQQNYPNPFNPTTSIAYTVPKASDVTLTVFDALGRQVAKLVDGYKAANTYNVQFDGSALASGVYFYTLEAKDYKVTHKMMLMK